MSGTVSVAVYTLLVALHIDLSNLEPPKRQATFSEFFGAVLIAPGLETFVLAGAIALISRASSSRMFVAVASALLWGALHATLGVLWFFGTACSFFIFSGAYLAWRRVSFSTAFWAAAIPHALVNATAMCLIFVAASFDSSVKPIAPEQLRPLVPALQDRR